MYIVDRRLNPGGKSLSNRQRFLRRAKSLVERAVRDGTKERGIREIEQEGEVSIPTGGINEPRFHRSPKGGHRDHVLPGNKEFIEGDTIPRPKGGGGGAGGAGEGEGEDDFRFVLSREEYLSLFLDDLELPDLAKQKVADTENLAWRRAGFTVSGSPANIAFSRTMRNALARRIALRRPKPEEALRLEAEIEALERSGDDPERLEEAKAALALLNERSRRIPYIDPIDVRYRRFDTYPKPMAQAVMFCLMDVSGSMSEHMKDLAKRFFALLYIFLQRRYRHVDIVFVRHTHKAEEVDEDAFFHSTETGGTVVSTALEETQRIIAQRYPVSEWNIYVAQASDGDNMSTDNEKTATLLRDAILPVCQYFAYLEVGDDSSHSMMDYSIGETTLWRTYREVRKDGSLFAMRKVTHRREIYPVFRELFAKRREAEKSAW